MSKPASAAARKIMVIMADQRLSLKAKAIAVTIIVNADAFSDVENTGKLDTLVKMSSDGMTSVRSGLSQLAELGILKRDTQRTNTFPHGVKGVVWEIVV